MIGRPLTVSTVSRTIEALSALVGCLFVLAAPLSAQTNLRSLAAVVSEVQPKVVKIYGSGGLRGLEAYQSGILVSGEGHVVTVWSYVLDSEEFLFVVLDDGQRFPAKIVNHDPRLEIAVLKIDGHDLPHFDLDKAVSLEVGNGVLAFSNLFGVATGAEPVSVLHGRVSATTKLTARRGAFETVYKGPVYIVDAMTNNPGAAGGALTDVRGRLAGLLGKELRNALTNVWLNYAIPVDQWRQSVQDMIAGKNPPRVADASTQKPERPHTVERLGILLVPDVLAKTPPFVDQVEPGSAAERAGLQPDDLILFVDGNVADSIEALREELSYIDRIDPVPLTVQRGDELLEIELKLTPTEADR
ncbi:MAG TPA: serine protease [Planctomycetaceae bacterium]|nr:serine protease [Planctomycetaceae bacterium]